MPHSLRAKLSGLRYKGILEDKDYKRLCHALDLEKAEQEPTMQERVEKEYLFESICEDLKKLQAENDELRKQLKPCEDTVSRQAVLKQLRGCLTGGETEYQYVKLHIDSIPSVRPQEPKWIPVSERLPKSSGVYIVSRWFSDGEESAILTDANYYDGNGDWYNDNRINWGRDLVTDKIVAWMPLPKPYEPQESEE